MSGLLLRIFDTRDPVLMKMFNAYIRSKIEYCSLIWSPWKKEAFDKLEKKQKNYTSNTKIDDYGASVIAMSNSSYTDRRVVQYII